jgi:hypothetical protein
MMPRHDIHSHAMGVSGMRATIKRIKGRAREIGTREKLAMLTMVKAK